MGQLDTAIKEFSKTSLAQLVRWLHPHLKIVSVIEMPQELPASLRHVDVLAKTLNERDAAELQILECQAQKDPLLAMTMLLRAALAHMHYGLPVSTLLLALTPEAAVSGDYIYGRCGDRPLVHSVEVRRLYEEPAEAALESGVTALLPLAPLMRPADGDRTRLLSTVIARIADLPLNPERKKLLIGWAATFASLNLSRAQVSVIVRDVSRRRNFMLNALQDLPLMREIYQEGQEKGLEQGVERERRNSLVLIYEARLGPLPAPVHQALLKIADPGRLAALFPLFLSGSATDIAGKLLPGTT